MSVTDLASTQTNKKDSSTSVSFVSWRNNGNIKVSQIVGPSDVDRTSTDGFLNVKTYFTDFRSDSTIFIVSQIINRAELWYLDRESTVYGDPDNDKYDSSQTLVMERNYATTYPTTDFYFETGSSIP